MFLFFVSDSKETKRMRKDCDSKVCKNLKVCLCGKLSLCKSQESEKMKRRERNASRVMSLDDRSR